MCPKKRKLCHLSYEEARLHLMTKNDDYLRHQDDLKIEDDLKYEDNSKNEDDPKNEKLHEYAHQYIFQNEDHSC